MSALSDTPGHLLRPARSDDLAAIHEIYAESVRNGVATYELVPPSLREMTTRFEAITANGYPWLVADLDGGIAGYAYASAFRTRPAYRWLVEDSIYLAPEARGRGLGGKLLGRLLADCEALGFRQMVAVIGGAHPASIAVHHAAGFVSCGRMRATGFKFGRWLDTELMQIQLGEGDESAPDEQAYPGSLFMP